MPSRNQNIRKTNLRVPPQNIEAEAALLGSIMLRPEAFNEIFDVVKPESFYSEKHRIIFRTMMELFSKSAPIDILSLSSRLQEKELLEQIGGSSFLAELLQIVPSSTNAKHYGEIIRKKFMMRNLIAAAERVSELGWSEESDLEELLDKAEKSIFEVTNFSGTHKFIELKDTLAEAWERLDRLHKSRGELRGVGTGFKELDNKLAGLQKSDLIILAARPSMGKTALALDIARQSAASHNTAVGIFSLEMSSQQLVDRMLASDSRVDAWKLRTGKLSIESEFNKIRDSLDKLSKAPIYIDDQPGNNILKMRSIARRLKSEKGLGLLIVDYLQLMVPTNARAGDNLVQQVTEISRSLKHLARELDIPVLALSQLSRAVESRGGKPRLSDLRDSGCLSGETIVVRADNGERLKIKDLVGKTDIPVFSLNHEYKLVKKQISKVFSSGIKETFEVATRSGRSIRASVNHPFFTFSGWKRLDELEAGTRVALPRKLAASALSVTAISSEELILLAHLLGDGCVLPRQPIHYTSADSQNIRAVAAAAKKTFGIKPRLVQQKNWWHLYLPSPYRLARGKHHPIINWYEKMGLSPVRSYQKRLPSILFQCSSEQIRLFLKHLWATDGNISWKLLPNRKPAASIYYASSSKNLATDVQHLLLRLGIWSSLKKVAQKGYRPMFHVHVQSSPIQLDFCKQVGSFGKRGNIVPRIAAALEKIIPNPNNDTLPSEIWKLLIEPEKLKAGLSWRQVAEDMKISYNGAAIFANGVSRERLTRVAQVLSSKHLLHLAESDVYWDEIISITHRGAEEMYDATIPDTHNFVADDFIVHNSIEQDADVVMFIHREDKYNENSDKPNIAEILIEKHRNGPTGKVELYFDDKTATFLSLEKGDFGDFEVKNSSENF